MNHHPLHHCYPFSAVSMSYAPKIHHFVFQLDVYNICMASLGLLLLFAMIRSVVKSFKVPGVEVVASRMSNEAALTRMIDSTPKKLGHT